MRILVKKIVIATAIMPGLIFSTLGLSALSVARAAVDPASLSCSTINLVSSMNTQTAGFTETNPLTAPASLQSALYSAGVFQASTVTQAVIPPWIDPATDSNFATSSAMWISTHATWPGGVENTEGSAANSQWRLFEDSFTLPVGATVMSADVMFAADNATNVYLNGNSIPVATTNGSSSEDVYGTTPMDGPQNFSSVFTAPFNPVVGSNTLDFVVRNWSAEASSNPTGLLYKATVHYCVPIVTPPATVKVTIAKYLDGTLANASSANSTSFPMHATYPGGEGDYALSPVGFNNATPYEATTGDMSPGADYSTYEITSNDSQVLPMGSACAADKYLLEGYQTSAISLADAASSTVQTSTPSFTNLMSDQYVIVRNVQCPSTENLSPFFLSWNPITTATANQPYSYDVNAQDPESDPLVFSLVSSTPAGMTMNASTGLISWTPTPQQATSTPYTVTVQVSDPTHTISRDYQILVGNLGGEVLQTNGVLAVNSVTIAKSTTTADGTFAGGWRYVFHITAPTNEPNLAMKFANWINGVNSSTIPVANNMRISSAQANNGGATVLLTAANLYSSPALTMNTDLDPTVSGRQVDVVVEVSIPVGTPAAAYTTNYGVQTSL